MNELQEFAGHARSFQRWILESQSEGASVAREALLELTGLYAAALGLPSPFLADTETEHSARVDDAEFNRVRTWCARLPFQYYGEVFDPTVVPPEEPVAGNVADDIADVYRDVVTGLRLSTQVSSTTPFGSGVLVSELIGASTDRCHSSHSSLACIKRTRPSGFTETNRRSLTSGCSRRL